MRGGVTISPFHPSLMHLLLVGRETTPGTELIVVTGGLILVHVSGLLAVGTWGAEGGVKKVLTI